MKKPYFYRQEGDHFHPSDLARSPWQKGVQNGVGMGGLLTYLAETVPTPAPMLTARLTIDILSAAPFAPTLGRTRILREGKRIQLVEAELVIDERVVARASALRVRTIETPIFGLEKTYPPPESGTPSDFMGKRAFGGTMETRIVKGGLREPGPGTVWVKFGHEHVEGMSLSPLIRAASLSDFGSGLGSVLDVAQWSYANLDITTHLVREPRGDWILVDAETASAGQGSARSDMALADRDGIFARAHQTLFVAPQD